MRNIIEGTLKSKVFTHIFDQDNKTTNKVVININDTANAGSGSATIDSIYLTIVGESDTDAANRTVSIKGVQASNSITFKEHTATKDATTNAEFTQPIALGKQSGALQRIEIAVSDITADKTVVVTGILNYY